MNTNKPSEPESLISCDICLAEIPASETNNDETTEYVIHYCGLECYEKWKSQPEDKDKQSST